VTAAAGAAATGSSPAIDIVDVVKRYGDRSVLDGVNLRVAAGEIVALLGPNGAGKTTLVEIVEGYRTADGGVVRVLGEEPARGGPALRARVGLMLQSGGLDPRTTPRDVLRLYRAFHEGGRDPDSLLSLVGLASVAATSVRRLSGGERQRLALALALVGEPEVLVLDEPTAGMDPEARRAARQLIDGLRSDGRTILLTTHDLGDVEALADRVAILDRGRIIANGSPAELVTGGQGLMSFRLHALPDAAAIERLSLTLSPRGADAQVRLEQYGAPGSPAARDATTFRIVGQAPAADTIATVAGWAVREGLLVVELRAGSMSLEDRYLELTGDAAVERGG
jgi:ABC-2 type transport system ATP-binding protein